MTRILGLDPGTAITGYGLVEFNNGAVVYLDHGCITTPKDLSAADRLVMITRSLAELIQKHQPQLVAIEELFFAANTTTAISVAQARGAMIATITQFNLPITGYTPLQVKQAVTGDGRADKRQIQKMVKMILGLVETPSPDDAADALAIAVTHAHAHTLMNKLKL